MSQQLRTVTKITIPVIIGIAVAAFLFRNEFNPDSLKMIKFDARVWTAIVLALVCVAGRECGMAWRYHILSGNRLSAARSLRITFLCEFVSCITPTSVGGSAASAIFMARNGLSGGRSTTVMLTTLFLDELFIMLAVPLTFLFIPYRELFGFSREALAHDFQITFWIVYGILSAWCILLAAGLFISPHYIRKILITICSFPLLRRWKKSATNVGDDLVESARELKSCPFSMWRNAFSATAMSWVSRFLTVNALIWGLAPASDQIVAAGRQLIVWVLLMFTPTPGGSGMSEWIFTEYYSDMVSTGAVVMVLALLWRALTYYLYLPIGIALIPSVTKKHK